MALWEFVQRNRFALAEQFQRADIAWALREDYPDDKYGPSCLVLGFTRKGRPLHIQCSHPSRLLVKIITLYEPSADEWIDFKSRKGKP